MAEILGRVRRTCSPFSLLAALGILVLSSLLPAAVRAQGVCNGQLSIVQQTVQNPNTVGSIDTIRLVLTTGNITGGTANELTVSQVFFDLDCLQASLPGCSDDGAVISYMGDATISSTCKNGATPVVWSSGHAVSTTPNQVVFSASPAVVLEANDGTGCYIQFQIQKESGPNPADADQTKIAELAGYSVANCDNGGTSTQTQSASLPFTAPEQSCRGVTCVIRKRPVRCQ